MSVKGGGSEDLPPEPVPHISCNPASAGVFLSFLFSCLGPSPLGGTERAID
jgi:hypothetical protein